MRKECVYCLVEPSSAMPIWFSRAIAGLKENCARHRLPLIQLENLTDLDSIEEQTNSVIIISSQNSWTYHAVQALCQHNIMPILLGAIPEEFGEHVSGVKLARKVFIEKIIEYFLNCGRRRIALVGVNRNASNDAVKAAGFLDCIRQYALPLSEQDIYWIDTDISNSVLRVLGNAGKYDAVICSNDYVAVTLLAHARTCGICIPNDLYVVGLGDTLIGRYTSPTLTSTNENEFYEMGRQAFSIWQTIAENPFLTSIVVTVGTEIIARGSTAYSCADEPLTHFSPSSEPTISIGQESQTVRSLENCLRGCDDVDLQILRSILCGKSNEQIENEMFLAHSSLYYRLHKLYQVANVSNRDELKQIFAFYLPCFEENNE